MADALSIQQVDRQVKGLLRQIDSESLVKEEKQSIQDLKQLLNEVRLEIRDYDFAQTRDEQLKHGKLARKQLRKLVDVILALSSLFGPADIAQLTAQLEQLSEKLT